MIVAIVGPTGTGKTALAVELAQRVSAEIVNLDSRQVYRGLDIGSAKPTREEQRVVPHHLFDVVDPDETFDCARYRDLARRSIAEIESRAKHVLLVGGTGLYLKVLCHGLFDGPRRDTAVRAKLNAAEDAGPGSLHRRLREVDPPLSNRLHPHDRVRLVRALEVYELTGKPMSQWQEEHAFRERDLSIRPVGLNMDRQALYERLDARCGGMVEAGLIDEVRGLRARGYGSELASLRSIGYREIGFFLDGQCTLEEALSDMARATRRLAKRQFTWFRAVPELRWYNAATVEAADLMRDLFS